MNWGRNFTSKKLHLTAGVTPHGVGRCPERTEGTGSKAVQMSQNLEGLGFTLVQFGQGYRDTVLDMRKTGCFGRMWNVNQDILLRSE